MVKILDTTTVNVSMKWNETKRNETKRNETKRNETKWNEMKWNEKFSFKQKTIWKNSWNYKY